MRWHRIPQTLLAAAAALGCAPPPVSTGLAFLFAQGYLGEKDGGRFREDRAFWTLINDSLDARLSKPKRIADGDIADTQEADPAMRAIRIIRSPVSYNERPFQPGKYGEEILANSAD